MLFKLSDENRSLSDSWIREVKDVFTDHKYGIKTLHSRVDAIVDIVFIHGITGHRDHTWTKGKSSESWPRLFLPYSIPEARIVTFGYDAGVTGWRGISGNRLGDHSMNLLSALAAYRAADETDQRPIIFIAHSLGGLVVKDALLTSRISPEAHLQQIVESTCGILFLGTPHLGSSLAAVASKLAKLAGTTARTNTKVLNVLRKDSEVLSRIQSDFYSLLRSQQSARQTPWDITCCYEELPINGIGEIVTKESAILPGYPAIGIHQDHREMVRFATPHDPGYVSVVGELQRWVKKLQFPASREGDNLLDKRDAEDGFGKVVIWGDVSRSVVVSGMQTIHGNISFRR
ncbi:Alpha/Beta hydrolase protein [Xylariaceae sp. FL1019]|nr:Alpha/Beta hydrolase protein [Xylariaceae sp. FL1019]